MAENREDPTVSVVLPVFNVSSFIGRTLDSIVQQAGVTFEVVVVDDASTDDTVRLIEERGDPRIRVLRLPDNRGPWFARNEALAQARGEWLAFVDGDDWWHPDRLRTMVASADTLEADMVMDDMVCVLDADGAPVRTALEGRGISLSEPTEVRPKEFITWNLGVMKPLISRAFVEHQGIRFNGELRAGGDFSMFLHCLLAGARAFILPDALYYYRIRGGQITADRSNLFRGTLAAAEESLERAEAFGDAEVSALLRGRVRDIADKIVLNRALVHLRRGEVPSALTAIARRPQAIRYVGTWLLNSRYRIRRGR